MYFYAACFILDLPEGSGMQKSGEKSKKAVALISDGLDSALAIKLMQLQGFEVLALHFVNPFDKTWPEGSPKAHNTAKQLGVEIREIVKGQDYIDIIRKPKHGFGSGINPCIDCRIHLLKSAKTIMQEIGAVCIVTGEVIGQRPMSQMKNQMDIIARKAEVEEILVRPLCGKLLPPSKPEIDGLLEREKFEDIQGRTRKRQLELAKSFGLENINSGGGGCLLTDKMYARKVKDFYDNKVEISSWDYRLAFIGRHFRFDSETKAVVGRQHEENEALKDILREGSCLFEPSSFVGPSILLEGEDNQRNRRRVFKLLGAYTKPKKALSEEKLKLYKPGRDTEEILWQYEKVENSELDDWKIT